MQYITKSTRLAALLMAGAFIAGNGLAQTFLTNGLVAYYPFKGSAADASGHGNDGIPFNTASASDRFGEAFSALAFNGINGSTDASVVEIPNSIINLGQLGYTLSLWMMPSNVTQVTRTLFGNANTSVGLEVGFNNNNEPGTIDFSVGPGNSFWSSVNNHSPVMNFQAGQWYAVSLTKSNWTYSLYINGQLEDQVNVPAAAGYNFRIEPLIGAYGFDGSEAFQVFTGNINDVRIYNRAFSSNEIAQLYACESQTIVSLKKAVKPSFSNLYLGTNYQLQVSSDLITWINSGSPFTPTNTVMDYPQYWDVDNWNDLFFRLQVSP
jgi:hypothetical protein